MYFVLSGEGPSDLGTAKPGPIAWLINNYIEKHLGYSLLECSGSSFFVPEGTLAKIAKSLPTRFRGKKADANGMGSETRYYYKNARALGVWIRQQNFDAPVLALLFRDADGTASSGRGEWLDKRQSIARGFEDEGISGGIPVVPKPKSEAWLLCALKYSYTGCHKIELEASGNDRSPKSLKDQLDAALLEKHATSFDCDFISSLVRDGHIEFARLEMTSASLVRQDLDAALSTIALKL